MIEGWTAPGWEKVSDTFEENFAKRHEVGAAFAAYHRGEKVVDLWGGLADEKTQAPWQQDTMTVVFSCTKGVTAMCANRLAEQGLLQMDDPVATYWPEFARNGKGSITVADLLSHRAGLAWTDGEMSTADALSWTPVVEALQDQSPSYKPRSAHGYHATTFGWLVGEVVRRITGQTLGTFARKEFIEPLGADFYIGLPKDQEVRVAKLIPIIDSLVQGRSLNEVPGATPGGAGPALGDLAKLAETYFAPDGPLFKALAAPGGALADDNLWNSYELHAAEIPAAGGICDARSLALLYSACIVEHDGFRILSEKQLDAATEPQTEGPDTVLLGLDIQFGLGFMLNRGLISLAGIGGKKAFGHFGMGGSSGWADPDAELAMAYVMNRMDIGTTGDTRSFNLMSACYASLG